MEPNRKCKVTVVAEFDLDPANYDPTLFGNRRPTPEEMLEAEKQWQRDGSSDFVDLLIDSASIVTFELLPEGA